MQKAHTCALLGQVLKEALGHGEQGPVVLLEYGSRGQQKLCRVVYRRRLLQPLRQPGCILFQAMRGSCDVGKGTLACTSLSGGQVRMTLSTHLHTARLHLRHEKVSCAIIN